jgi:uncharacterized protein YegP (UPF0339 family)
MAPRTRRIEIYEATDGHRWRLTAPNGNIIADSGDSYPTNALAVKAARSLFDLSKPVVLAFPVIRKGKTLRVEEEQILIPQL